MLQPHFISCRGVSGGRRQHARIQDFLSVLFSPQLILKFKEGYPMVLLLRKLYLYFTKDPEAVYYFPGGGGGIQLFFQGGGGGGIQMLIFIETHICTCYFPG